MTTTLSTQPTREPAAGPDSARYALDVVVLRGTLVEQEHLMHAAVVDARGALLASARDPHVRAHWRSAAMPFQQLDFVGSGGPAELRWAAEYLALACGSHLGERKQVDLVRLMLRSVHGAEDDLVCAATEPGSDEGEEYLERASQEPGRVHNPCSGKHAAMVACCRVNGWDVAGYHRPEHPLQRAILATVSAWTDVPEAEIVVATDGCGVPQFGIPLARMALAYARLVQRAREPGHPAGVIVDAMAAYPYYVGGTGAFDTLVIESTGGNVIARDGADGVSCFGIRDRALGVAIYAPSANRAAKHTAAIRLLQELGALPPELPESLRACVRSAQAAIRGEVAGEFQVP